MLGSLPPSTLKVYVVPLYTVTCGMSRPLRYHAIPQPAVPVVKKIIIRSLDSHKLQATCNMIVLCGALTCNSSISLLTARLSNSGIDDCSVIQDWSRPRHHRHFTVRTL